MEAKPKIWLVDEEPNHRDLMRIAFEHIGGKQEILLLINGNELIERLDISEEEEYPSLIVLGYNLEDRGGEEILRQIKDNPFTSPIPVIIYTSTITTGLRPSLQGSGALMIIEKGEDVTRLEQQAQFFLDLVS